MPDTPMIPTIPSEQTAFTPATNEDAARLIDLIGELGDWIRHGQSMGLGDVSIANGIRAKFLDRILEEWCAGVKTEPLTEAQIDRLEAARLRARDQLRASSAAPTCLLHRIPDSQCSACAVAANWNRRSVPEGAGETPIDVPPAPDECDEDGHWFQLPTDATCQCGAMANPASRSSVEPPTGEAGTRTIPGADHELKVWPEYFTALNEGLKTFEFRRDDRTPAYQVGDVLRLREWGFDVSSVDAVRAGREAYTGRECLRRVTYVARGGVIPDGYCVMSVVPLFGGTPDTLTREERAVVEKWTREVVTSKVASPYRTEMQALLAFVCRLTGEKPNGK
jgi:hypothetical protein